MKFKIPFAGSNISRLRKVSRPYSKRIKSKKDSLDKYLKDSGAPISREEYIGVMRRSFLTMFFISLFLMLSLLLLFNKIEWFLFAIGFLFLFSCIIYMNQMTYPKIYFLKRQRDIERNLIPALEDMLIQLNSGIPLFSILVNISDSGYGELSGEFMKAVQKINAGESEVNVLEELSAKNPSNYFKRALWQISNGLNTGSDMSSIIRENIKTLNEEQMIQIQDYGNKLNPLIMMYMLISVIVPALSVSFMTVIASMIGLEKNLTMGLFLVFFVFILLFQIMFLGMIKSKRPSLL